MKKTVLFCVMILAVSAATFAVNVDWNPPADPNNPDAPALWSVAGNWTTGIVPNAADQSVFMATANSAACLLESGNTFEIQQLKLGEGGDGSSNGHLILQGVLDAGITSGEWSGVGAWNGQTGVLEIDGGVFNTYGSSHLWVASEGDGTVILKNGGEMNIGVGGDAQLGLGWNGTGVGRVIIKDGLVTVNNWTTGSIHPDSASFYNIELGKLSIAGYRISNPNDTSVTLVDYCAADGRIRGFGDANFDKVINVDNAGNNAENDIINNVLIEWDAANERTVLTAVHPQQPAPYFDDVAVLGDIEFGWDNWDPNFTGDDVSIELYVSTDPNGADYLAPVYSAVVTGEARSTATVNIASAGIYYWQVKTDNGTEQLSDLFWFEAVTYKAPELSGGDSVWTTLDLVPATMSASIETFGTPLTSVTLELLEDDLAFPTGADAILTPDTSDLENPTASLTTDTAGLYKVLLTVMDGTTTIEKIIAVDVYSDACQAKKDSPSGWVANYYDRDDDCDVDVADFAVLAEAWLNDTTMQVQESAPREVDYLPQSIFDARIEAESVDPDSVSDAPVTDETGVRIVPEGGASGGQALGWTGGGTWAEYEITVPSSGVYDVYVSTAAPRTDCNLNFGDGTTADLYGSIGPIVGTGWGNYNTSVHEGALLLPAGTYTVRITWTNEANLDWFSLVQQ